MKTVLYDWLNARLRKTPKLRAVFASIRGRIFTVFLFTFLSLIALTLLNFWSLSSVKASLLLGERYYDFLNNILEARRFEKNFLLYNDADSLNEGKAYLSKIDDLATELSDDIIKVTDRQTFDLFLRDLKDYEDDFKAYSVLGKHGNENVGMRQKGKALVDFAERLLETKKNHIHKAIIRTSVLPFAFLSIFLLLVLLVIKVISQGLLKPLRTLRTTINRVAKGDFSPTPFRMRHTDEVSRLIWAFNRMAEELKDNQENLLQAKKIAALGTFTAGIAHELNNPINNISLTAETFIETYSGTMDEEAKELMDDIISQSERASDIVRNLLDFSRSENPVFSNLEARAVMTSTKALVKNQIMLGGITLICDIPDSLPQIRGNLRSLQQVFMNLLLNSVHATQEGGFIKFRAACDNPDYVRFEVEDTGTGIRPEILERIFDPFYTTKSVGKGVGLGLSVTYSIVKRHGGKIEAKSELGKGSMFSVYLPIALKNEQNDNIEE